MVITPLPEDEALRLKSLQYYGVLDTPPDPRFDALTALAATLFNVPIAHVSMVDQDRLWLKSAVGLPQGFTMPRGDSFCTHAIQDTRKPLVVEDTASDPRFAELPAVKGKPHIRFYAGVPLADADGRGLGAFCILDTKPRRLSDAEFDQLMAIATGISTTMDLLLSMARLQESDTLAWSLFASTPSAVTLLDEQGRVLRANAASRTVLSYDGTTGLEGAAWAGFWPESERNKLATLLGEVRGGHTARTIARAESRDGTPSWWDIIGAPIAGMPGAPARIFCSARDITVHKRERDALAEARAQLEAVLESTTDHVFLVDGDWRITYLNRHAQELVGNGRNLIGLTLLDAVPEAAGSLFEQQIRYAAQAGKKMVVEGFLASRGLWLEVHAYPTPPGLSIFFRDVTERRRTQAELIRLAQHDSLTGLANRHMFRTHLGAAAAASDPVAVLLIDIDQFKDVNDTRGHPAGDVLLCQAASRLRGALRGEDILARVGGDEFAVIFSGVGHEAVGRAAARIIAEFALPFDIEGAACICGASVGVALSEDAGCDPDQLMKNADLALYAAKAAGRGTFRFFSADLAQRAAARDTLKSLLRQALPRQELSLRYQPVFDMHRMRVVGFEALLRWQRDGAEVAPPDEFIALAEETGLILPIGTWALTTACQQAVHWPDPVWVAVNLSPVQFRDPELVRMVRDILAQSGLPARRLELEITENALLRNDETTRDVLRALRGLGVRLALDDFGTGYASLGYLNHFSFDKIKVDRSFIRNLPESAESTAIVRALTSMGRSLGMVITAEGVETRAQQEAVRLQGCGEAQGYYFGAAMAAEATCRLVGGAGKQVDGAFRFRSGTPSARWMDGF
jgi:diguanylate cyclase (GGDEF)-like protein/PAS domain S-box-containing protein